jgi:2-haloacid dehalogenase
VSLNRREFVSLAAGALAARVIGSSAIARAASEPQITCLAFDAFPIFDPRPIGALAEQLFRGKGTELMNIWRARQFEYTWLRSAGERYADFWKVTEQSLIFATRSLKLDLPDEKRRQLMDAYLILKAWPDVAPALKALHSAGLRLAFLSNFTTKMLEAGIHSAGLGGLFEHVLSTDAAKSYKPAPAAYQLAIDAFKVPKEQILFIPFAAWDAAGAKWFGYKTFWVNRLGQPLEELDATPDGIGNDLSTLATFVNA